VGRSVVLDASAYGGRGVVQVFRAKATHPLYSKYAVMKTPSILFIDVNGNEKRRLTGDDVSSDKFLKTLKELLPDLTETAKGYNEEEEDLDHLRFGQFLYSLVSGTFHRRA
jgi:thioredoxin-related protein